jgi:hypothetical protein
MWGIAPSFGSQAQSRKCPASRRRYEQIRSFQPGCGQRLQRAGEERGREPMHLQYGGESRCDDMFIVNNENA